MEVKKLIHETNMKIRWGDMDGFGHVNNTLYFLYVQEARFKLMLDKKIPISPRKIAPVLAATSCKFIRPIVYPEEIIIETWFCGILDKKTIFEHVIKSSTNESMVYAILEGIIVWFDFTLNQSVDIPQEILEKMITDL